MKKLMLISIMFAMFIAVSCSSSSSPTTTPDPDEVTVVPDKNTDVPDTNNPTGCTADADCGAGQVCKDGKCETPACTKNEDCGANEICTDGKCEAVSGETCGMDSECPSGKICVGSSCVAGCTSDSDCSAYKNTKCHPTFKRCLNMTYKDANASTPECGSSCTTCCYAGRNLQNVKCSSSTSIVKCGACPQGQIWDPSTQKCLVAACDKSSDKCSDYNSELECTSNFVCGNGYTTLMNAASCVPAGEKCVSNGLSCCSGQPCVQGYCY